MTGFIREKSRFIGDVFGKMFGARAAFADNAVDIEKPWSQPHYDFRIFDIAEQVLQSTRLGAALLRNARECGVEYCWDFEMATIGLFNNDRKTLTINPRYLAGRDDPETEVAQTLHLMAHELQHANQFSRLTALPDGSPLSRPEMMAPRDYLMLRLHMEAAAWTAELVSAVDLSATHPGVFRSSALDTAQADLRRIFLEESEARSGHRAYGGVFRAVYDHFYENWNRLYAAETLEQYYDALVENCDSVLSQSGREDAARYAQRLGRTRLSDGMTDAVAELPDRMNLMRVPGMS